MQITGNPSVERILQQHATYIGTTAFITDQVAQ